jgi:hypothetical protein
METFDSWRLLIFTNMFLRLFGSDWLRPLGYKDGTCCGGRDLAAVGNSDGMLRLNFFFITVIH